MLQRWSTGSHAKPADIIGPEGVKDVVSGFNTAYKLDADYRTADHGCNLLPPSGAGGIAKTFRLSQEDDGSAVVWNKDGVRITMFKVDHNRCFPPSVTGLITMAGRW